MVFLSSSIALLISYLIVLSITERRVLKFSTITMDLFLFVVLPVFIFHILLLCYLAYMHLELLYLLGELIFQHYAVSLYVPGNFICFSQLPLTLLLQVKCIHHLITARRVMGFPSQPLLTPEKGRSSSSLLGMDENLAFPTSII